MVNSLRWTSTSVRLIAASVVSIGAFRVKFADQDADDYQATLVDRVVFSDCSLDRLNF
jgi:hypothetical protein